MADIDWSKVWDDAINSNALYPHILLKKDKLSLACPTQFSKSGEFSIEINPKFNNNSLSLSMLLFNNNVELDDLSIDKVNKSNFNALAKPLVEYEMSNRISNSFEIKSDGYNSHEEAVNSLIFYLNKKAMENANMFDSKLQDLNSEIATKSIKKDLASRVDNESCVKIVESMKCGRQFIMKKIESILSKYDWKTSKNEDLTDTTASFYDNNKNLVAVVSLVDNFIVVDLAKNITAKVSMLQSDEEIENELTDDVDAANELLASREVTAMKDAIASNPITVEDSVEDNSEYLESLFRRVTKLENAYIRRRLHEFN